LFNCEDLEVLGKGTPVIYINGRKMQDKDKLKRLRSEEIQSVSECSKLKNEIYKHLPNILPSLRMVELWLGEDILTPGKRALNLREDIPTSENRALNLRHIIPT
jgi:hypothetical protein